MSNDHLPRGDGRRGDGGGFSHLGRFAAEYRRRFGELSSQTLVRGGARRSKT